jgi:hypothetical protein
MNDIYLYRFKTEEEFITKYGKDWMNAFPGFGWCRDMNYLLGTDLKRITKENVHLYEDKNDFSIISWDYDERWTIIWKMITLKKIIPTYQPKKLSYE